MASLVAPRTNSGFKVAVICALPLEAENVQAIFDRCWDDEGRQYSKAVGDQNEYTTGVIGRHNVVLVHMPNMGNNSASQVAANLRSSYPQIQLALVTGICGVAPMHPQTQEEIVLGDVVISTTVTQYDFGQQYPQRFLQKREVDDSLGRASPAIRALINRLQTRPNRQRLTTNLTRLIRSDGFREKVSVPDYPGADQDWLYEASYVHQHRPLVDCTSCDKNSEPCSKGCHELGCEEEKRILPNRHAHPKTKALATLVDGAPVIHFGRFGSANMVLKSGSHRDELSRADHLTAFEMEGAGVWEQHPTIVIKAACDYADSHKNEAWQAYAAAVAAGCLKVFLSEWVPVDGPEEPPTLGFCLASAPLIRPDQFVGRAVMIEDIHHVLHPDSPPSEQQQVVLGGIGGIGKTQLAIAYARRYIECYSSVLWLNASSEQTLHASIYSVAEQLVTPHELEQLDQEQVLRRVRGWLAHPSNHRWLLIFDNYDDPDQVNLDNFRPNTSHGAVIVTTRYPDEVSSTPLQVTPLKDMDDSLAVLQKRSRREGVKHDVGARALAKRLAGLPLALVTAGGYLCSNHDVSFQEYLDAYIQRWRVGRRPVSPQEYQDRTLYTTWDLTYTRLQTDDAEAAQTLKLLAYFDHQAMWYGLFRAGLPDHLPAWLPPSFANRVNFGDVISTLVKYCLVEVQHATQLYTSYSMHSCVHDWTLGALNQDADPQLYWYAFDCVAASIDRKDWETLGQVRYGRLSLHAVHLVMHHRFQAFDQASLALLGRLDKAIWTARMLQEQVQLDAAEQMYQRAQAGCEKALGPDHTSTLSTVNNLAILYSHQGKLDAAEQMYQRALAGWEKALGPDHTSTLNTVNNLAILYSDQGKLDAAEQIYSRALAEYEKALGRDHPSTLRVMRNLNTLYSIQGS